MMWTWVAAAVLAVLAALVLSQVTLQITFRHQGKDDEISAYAKALFGIVHLKFSIPLIRFKNLQEGLEIHAEQVNENAERLVGEQRQKIGPDKIKDAYENIMTLLQNCFHFNEWLRNMLCHVRCTRMEWRTSVGIGDAAETAFLAGALWGVKTSILGLLFRFIPLQAQPKLAVIPAFNQKVILVEGVCGFRVRMWYVLSAGVQLLLRILRIKGGLRAWRNVLLKPS
ncbi:MULTISPECIES: DUF2953 domain-containing protein [Paenibacillus]|uniref:DUF2953 domain-containing protein n=1 Tax=Paenibacillus TaxID=44249 RepID=UPI0022B8C18A|nr:DUF2953 domain-containing protein [Paenibacillus caseinilyticus]MCZ8520588.1 DUF2953 domain-containing protein [Paenibacillus caseinilyticus]